MKLIKFIESFNNVATKYLQNYLNWLLILDKIKNSTNKITILVAIVFTANATWF